MNHAQIAMNEPVTQYFHLNYLRLPVEKYFLYFREQQLTDFNTR